MISGSASAEQPPPADPTSNTQQFAAITTIAQAPFLPAVLVAHTAMGNNPVLAQLDERAERTANRNSPRVRPAAKKTRAVVIKRVSSNTEQAGQYAGRHRAAPKPRVKVKKVTHRTTARKTTVSKKARTKAPRTRVRAPRGGMGAVVAYARAQVGDRYRHGAVGPNAFDCSGLAMKAYQRAGISLPHSSGAIAARAHTVPRAKARPGDLVLGPGHVGIYMGGGMMVDAGNQRVGVAYRRMYSGLRIARL
jgi:cell wall-associated NlpC family hydrolase